MTDDFESLAREQIADYLSRRDLSQKRFCRGLGLSPGYISSSYCHCRVHTAVLRLGDVIPFSQDVLSWARHMQQAKKVVKMKRGRIPAATLFPISYQRWA